MRQVVMRTMQLDGVKACFNRTSCGFTICINERAEPFGSDSRNHDSRSDRGVTRHDDFRLRVAGYADASLPQLQADLAAGLMDGIRQFSETFNVLIIGNRQVTDR